MKLDLLGVSFCLLAAGCSTPQVALDQANDGVALTTGLQRELATHERRQAAFDEARKKVIISETVSANRYRQDNILNDRLLQLSDQGAKLNSYQKVRDVAELRAKVIRDKASDEKAVRDAMDALMKPLPAGQEKIDATQKSFADLGTELSYAERLKLVTTLLQKVREEIDKNKKAADSQTPTSTD